MRDAKNINVNVQQVAVNLKGKRSERLSPFLFILGQDGSRFYSAKAGTALPPLTPSVAPMSCPVILRRRSVEDDAAWCRGRVRAPASHAPHPSFATQFLLLVHQHVARFHPCMLAPFCAHTSSPWHCPAQVVAEIRALPRPARPGAWTSAQDTALVEQLANGVPVRKLSIIGREGRTAARNSSTRLQPSFWRRSGEQLRSERRNGLGHSDHRNGHSDVIHRNDAGTTVGVL